MRALAAVAAIVAFALASGGCAPGGPDLKRSDGTAIVTPAPHADVTLPTTVTWAAEGIDETDVAERGLYFALFVDKTPIRPGQSLLALADDSCRQAGGGCANNEYFARLHVYLTAEPSVTLNAMPIQHGRHDDRHELAIVLIDANGKRWSEFLLRRTIHVEPAA